MSICKIIQGLAVVQQTVLGGTIQEHPQIDISGEALQLGIQFKQSIHNVTFLVVEFVLDWLIFFLIILL